MNASIGSALPACLEARSITLMRGAHCLFSDVCLTLHPGQTTAIIGTNGAGKSSVLQVLAGLMQPHSGTVLLAGRPLATWPARLRAQQIAWMPQAAIDDSPMSVHDLVMLGRVPHQGHWGAASPADHAAVARALVETDCIAFAARRIDALSGGERQRVLLARVLATEAPILLLDEPSTHLDAPQQRRLRAALTARQRAGTAILMVVHDLTHALSADQLILLHKGQVKLVGPPHDPAVQAGLCAALDDAIRIEAIQQGAHRLWVAVPQDTLSNPHACAPSRPGAPSSPPY